MRRSRAHFGVSLTGKKVVRFSAASWNKLLWDAWGQGILPLFN